MLFALAGLPRIHAAVNRSNTMRLQKNAGFTLLEMLLALGIAATVLLAASALLGTTLEARVRAQTAQEVHEQGLLTLHSMLQASRNAENIIAPAAGSIGTSLSLDVIATALDPTIFSLSWGALNITEGLSAAEPLTNSRIRLLGFTAENLSRPGTPGTVRIQFTAENVNPSGRSEYTFQETFTGSAALRQ